MTRAYRFHSTLSQGFIHRSDSGVIRRIYVSWYGTVEVVHTMVTAAFCGAVQQRGIREPKPPASAVLCRNSVVGCNFSTRDALIAFSASRRAVGIDHRVTGGVGSPPTTLHPTPPLPELAAARCDLLSLTNFDTALESGDDGPRIPMDVLGGRASWAVMRPCRTGAGS